MPEFDFDVLLPLVFFDLEEDELSSLLDSLLYRGTVNLLCAC